MDRGVGASLPKRHLCGPRHRNSSPTGHRQHSMYCAVVKDFAFQRVECLASLLSGNGVASMVTAGFEEQRHYLKYMR